MTRAAFFVAIGGGLAALERPPVPSIAEEVRRIRGERTAREGLANGEFVLRDQPMVAADTGEIRGAEALVRWIHPERGELPPPRSCRSPNAPRSSRCWAASC